MKTYKASEYIPGAKSKYCTVDVLDCETVELVYYDYQANDWFSSNGEHRVDVIRWMYPQPEKINT